MSTLMQSVLENLQFLLVCLLVAIGLFLIASVTEKRLRKKNRMPQSVSPARRVTMVGLFAAISTILMMFEFPLWFAPTFYKLDFSEIPIMICAFAMGPVAGVTTELCKILLKLVLKGTTTAFVGDFSNFVLGCAFVLPASIVYYHKKSRKSAIAGLITGTVVMTVFGGLFNAMYLLPKFAELYGMPMESIIAMGTALNSHITSVWTLVFFAVTPFNIIKGVIVSLANMLLYKHISPFIKGQ